MSNNLLLLESFVKQRKNEVAPELTEQDFFEIFSVENILKDKDLSYDDILSGIVDGGDDGGIDAIYLLITNSLMRL